MKKKLYMILLTNACMCFKIILKTCRVNQRKMAIVLFVIIKCKQIIFNNRHGHGVQ